jgi:predicted phosphodiesterase
MVGRADEKREMTPAKPTRLAVISDVHGNRWALEEVLRDIAGKEIHDIVNLGDCFYGPLDPKGTADILIPLGLPTVRGNEDRLITDAGPKSPTLHFVRRRLRPEHVEWLKTLPPTAVAFDDFFMCHASPGRDDEYLLQVVSPAGVSNRDPGSLADALSGVSAAVVLCGHDHVPASANTGDGRLVVDPGSVGLQAYTDDAPHPHAMEVGTTDARYAILRGSGGGWQVDDIAVPYDWEAAAAEAEKNGREDWAGWLRTGRASAPPE